ncbi:MAG: lipid-binding SYLF domain-containing protein [Solirubrobacterales bacterium]
MIKRLFALAVVAALACGSARAEVVSDQTLMVAKAASVVERVRRETTMARDLENVLARAKAVLIVPDLVKGGFLLGAKYGTGVLLTRDSGGRWSGPAFYSVAGGSFGLQIGLQDSEVLYVIMSAGGLDAIMNNRFKAGADVGVAVATVGAGAEASTTTNAGADIYAFHKAVGIYGGASLAGAGILPRHSWNAAYYGGNPQPEDILLRRILDSRQADRLRDVLAR